MLRPLTLLASLSSVSGMASPVTAYYAGKEKEKDGSILGGPYSTLAVPQRGRVECPKQSRGARSGPKRLLFDVRSALQNLQRGVHQLLGVIRVIKPLQWTSQSWSICLEKPRDCWKPTKVAVSVSLLA